MASVFKFRRKLYSMNTYKMKLSDLALEFGVQFPEDFKTLARLENSLDTDLHYWAVSTPGIYMTAPTIMIYNELQGHKKILPILVDNSGSVILHWNLKDGTYSYNGTILKGDMPLVNVLLNQLDKSMGSAMKTADDPEVDGGAVEVLKQDLTNYQMYRDLLVQAFGLQIPQQ